MSFDKTVAAIQRANLTAAEKESWAKYLDVKFRIKEDTIFADIGEVAAFIEKHLAFHDNIFRGQVKNWPIKSSMWRISEGEREKRWAETVKFMEWILNNNYLTPFHDPQEKLLAIAQHYSYEYSLITDLLDFTYDYKIACFFATDFKSIGTDDIGVVVVSNLPSMKVAYSYMGIDGIKQFDMKGMWRLENQKGLFLRDVNGDFEIFGRCIKLPFRQKEDVKYENESINHKSIYPTPNGFEEEINRYLDIKLRSRPIEEIDPDHIFQVIPMDRDPIAIEFETQLIKLNWENEKSLPWKSIELTPYESTTISDDLIEIVIDSYQHSELTTGEENGFINLISHIDKAGSTSFTPKVKLAVNIIDPLFKAETASQLFTKMVAEFSKNYGNLPFDMSHKITSLKLLSLFAIYKGYGLETVIDDELDILCAAYQTGQLINVEMEDNQGVVSRAYIDCDFCQRLSQMTYLKEQFNTYFKGRKGFLDNGGNLIDIHLEENHQLFQFVNKAKALFSWEDVVNIWALYVIPYQVVFRENDSSIFNPYYLEKFGLA